LCEAHPEATIGNILRQVHNKIVLCLAVDGDQPRSGSDAHLIGGIVTLPLLRESLVAMGPICIPAEVAQHLSCSADPG